jgi:DNA-binding transcriptional MocR family regulator
LKGPLCPDSRRVVAQQLNDAMCHFRTHALQQWAATFVTSSASVGKPPLSMWLRTTNGGVSRRQTCCTRSIATKAGESRLAQRHAAGMMFWVTRNMLAESYLLFTAANRARLRPTTRSSASPKESHHIRHGGRRARFKFQALSRLRASASAAALGKSVEARSVSVKSAPARLALDRSAPARSA